MRQGTLHRACTLNALPIVYAMGSSEKGQLGNGKTGEHFVSANKLAFATYSEPSEHICSAPARCNADTQPQSPGPCAGGQEDRADRLRPAALDCVRAGADETQLPKLTLRSTVWRTTATCTSGALAATDG